MSCFLVPSWDVFFLSKNKLIVQEKFDWRRKNRPFFLQCIQTLKIHTQTTQPKNSTWVIATVRERSREGGGGGNTMSQGSIYHKSTISQKCNTSP
jgi:hypothetical protein